MGEWWWCGVGWSVAAAAAAAMVSARGEQKCGLAGSLSLWGRQAERLAGAERETTSDNTRETELNREYGQVAYLGK